MTTPPMRCPCCYPDIDPDNEIEDMCECGHVLDEHDEDGQCTVDLEPLHPTT